MKHITSDMKKYGFVLGNFQTVEIAPSDFADFVAIPLAWENDQEKLDNFKSEFIAESACEGGDLVIIRVDDEPYLLPEDMMLAIFIGRYG